MTKRLTGLLASVALFSASLPHVTYAAGKFSNLPVVGGSSYCSSWIGSPTGQAGVTGTGGGTGAGAVCGQTVPAGPPALQSDMLTIVDIPENAASGAQPQTALVPVGLLGSAVNSLQGGDFTTNLWQRGTTPLSAASPTTAVMSADRFFAISASNAMTISEHAPATTDADFIGNVGILDWMRVDHPSGAASGSSCVGQILDQKASQRFINNNAVLSFWGYAPSGYTAVGSGVQVSIAYYTAGDSATGGTNTATFGLSASGQSGGIAGYTPVAAYQSGASTASFASGVATVPFTSTPTRYAVAGFVPILTGSTQVIGVGISFCGTPVGTGGVSDYFELAGIQLEPKSGVASTQFPNGVISPSPFVLEQPSVAAERQLFYSYVFNDGGTSGHGIFGTGWDISTSVADVTIPFPYVMREAPAATVSTATSFSVFELNGTTVQACTTLAAVGNSALTDSQAALTCTTGATNLTAGAGTQLTSQATGATHLVTFSAEP